MAIQGILGRMTFQDGTVLKALYGIAAIALIAVIGYVLWKMEQHNLYLSQISLAVLVPVFISPISWFHHAVILPIFMVCAAVDFYPFNGRYPGVDAHTLLLRAADEQPVMFVTSVPALALVVLVVLWAVLLRRPAENMQ